MTASVPDAGDADPLVRFRGDVGGLVAFVVATTVLTTLVNWGRGALFGADVSVAVDVVTTVTAVTAFGVVVLAILRHEGVQPADLGLSADLVVPGVAAVGGLWVGLNLLGLGLALATGKQASIGFLYDRSLSLALLVAVEQYLLVGMVEELAYRGYLQTRLVVLFDGRGDPARTALGIGLMAVVFAVTHVPNQLFVDRVAPGTLPVSLALLAVSAVLYGVVYELTGNLVLVGLLHGTLNQWPLLVDPRQWSSGTFLAWLVAGVVLLGLVVAGYRQWRAEAAASTPSATS